MPEIAKRAWHWTYRAAMVILLVLLAHHHWQIVSAPVPLDLYEGTMPLTTSIIADGGNPYARQYQPQAAYVYPPLYNLLMAPLVHVFGNSLQLHRVVSGLLIVASCLLCWQVCRRRGQAGGHAMAAAVLLYGALLFYGTPVASTNALGVLLFLAGLWIPWLYDFSNRSLVLALVFGLAAFYSKQYFLLGTAILCLYLFLFVSYRRALALGFSFAFLLAASLYLIDRSSPYFLDNTFFSPLAAASGLQMTEILMLQLRLFLLTYAGLLAIVAAGLLQDIRRDGFVNVWQQQPLSAAGGVLPRRVDFFWFSLFWATLAIILMLGRNPGNYMTYLFQLMSPFLLVAGFARFSQLSGRYQLAAPLILASFFQVYSILPKDFSTDLESWHKVDQIIANSDEILASQMLLMTLLDHDKKVYQNGHTFYFPLAADKPALFRKQAEEDRVEAVWKDYITSLYRKIERGEFDVILVSPWELRGIFERNPPPFEDVTGREFLDRHYYVADRVKLSMTDRYGGGTYKLQVWRPLQKLQHRDSKHD